MHYGYIEFKKKIMQSILESKIRKVVRESINKLLNEAYDKNILNGVSNITEGGINSIIKEMIPNGNRLSVKTPYKPLRQFVLYFSSEGAVKHGGRLTKDIVNHILKDEALKSRVVKISKVDKKILDLIYGKNRLSGRALMQEIIWRLDEITELLTEFNNIYEKSNIRNYFNGTEAINGSPDGKRKGLSQIMFDAYVGINEIKTMIKKMQNILDKPKDPFSYRIR